MFLATPSNLAIRLPPSNSQYLACIHIQSSPTVTLWRDISTMSTADNDNDDSGSSSHTHTTPRIHVPFINLQSNEHQDKNSPPSSSSLIAISEFEESYNLFQALHIRGYVVPKKCSDDEQFQACDVQSLFESLNDQDKASWCIENATADSSNNNNAQSTPPGEFLSINTANDQRGYCSFLVQHSKLEMNNLLANRLPLVDLPVMANESEEPKGDNNTMKVHYGPCLWFFFGINPENVNKEQSANDSTQTILQGRPEHTDSVTHDGTWHYQLSGTKIWKLRPTIELMQRIKEHTQQQKKEHSLAGTKRKIDGTNTENCCNDNGDYTSDKTYIEVECKEGDIIFLNTRLWWHSTLIPPQDVPCISYARDIYFCSDVDNEGSDSEGQERKKEHNQQQSSMTNIDGTYAAEDIEADTILFTEHTMPDCELHRSKTNPNCHVVELEDDITGDSYMAVVSLRDIKAGEFFSILESDDDDDDDDINSSEEVEVWREEDS